MSAPEHIVVAQLGARRGYAIASVLEQEGRLRSLDTDLTAAHGAVRLAGALAPASLRPAPLRRLLSRRVPGVPAAKIRHLPLAGLARVWRRNRRLSNRSRFAHYAEENRRFCEQVVARGLGGADAVYAFNGAALEIFEHARDLGLVRILEQTAPPLSVEEPLLAAERERWPDWEAREVGDHCPLAAREEAEWALADVLLCGSDFVCEGLASRAVPAERTRVVAYGVDTVRFAPAPARKNREPLRVLFVGTLQLRKGVPYLLEAARLVRSGAVRFRAVGPSSLTRRALADFARIVDVAGPVPRSDVPLAYHEADVLLCPSISEGSANVTYEALASGLPVVTTASAGSIVRDGVDGFIVPARSGEAIAEKLDLLAADRERLASMSANARRRAEQYSWEGYGPRILEAIEDVLAEGARRRGASA